MEPKRKSTSSRRQGKRPSDSNEPRGKKRLNLIITYSVHEVCMRGTRVISLIGQFFFLETYILFNSSNLNLENFYFRWDGYQLCH